MLENARVIAWDFTWKRLQQHGPDQGEEGSVSVDFNSFDSITFVINARASHHRYRAPDALADERKPKSERTSLWFTSTEILDPSLRRVNFPFTASPTSLWSRDSWIFPVVGPCGHMDALWAGDVCARLGSPNRLPARWVINPATIRLSCSTMPAPPLPRWAKAWEEA